MYAEKITKDGRKIPFLSKAIILKLVRNIGHSKGVSVLINYQENEHSELYSIICEFEENGIIRISSDFENILSIEDIDILLNKTVNPIIEIVKFYLEQRGYSIYSFKSLTNSTINQFND